MSKEVRALIFQMVAENPTWGAPRIHGELLKLGFKVSERTVSRWVKRASKNPDPVQMWLAFLRNHRQAIAAMDFFTVPTLTFGVLYCFFVISHDRRRILHCNVTGQPNALWIVLQLREAWGYEQPHRYLIFDRDAKFSTDVVRTVQQNGTEGGKSRSRRNTKISLPRRSRVTATRCADIFRLLRPLWRELITTGIPRARSSQCWESGAVATPPVSLPIYKLLRPCKTSARQTARCDRRTCSQIPSQAMLI